MIFQSLKYTLKLVSVRLSHVRTCLVSVICVVTVGYGCGYGRGYGLLWVAMVLAMGAAMGVAMDELWAWLWVAMVLAMGELWVAMGGYGFGYG